MRARPRGARSCPRPGFDVVVAGAGSAGFAAAVAAGDAGARVLLLEKAPAAEAGGNARFSHTGMRCAYASPDEMLAFLSGAREANDAARDPERSGQAAAAAGLLAPARLARLDLPGYSPAAFARDLDAATGGMIDPALRDVLAADSLPALQWLRALGMPFTLNRSITRDGREHFEPGMVLAAGGADGGRGMIAAWREIAARHRVTVRHDAAVTRIAPGGRGVTLRDGERIAARAVVVAGGGFQASDHARARHLGAAGATGVVRGTRHDTGELIAALLVLGAARAGSWDRAVTTPVDAASPPAEGGNRMNRYSYLYGITVDRTGRRFFDEGAGTLAATYGTVGRAILERPAGVAYQLFDAVGARLLKHYAYRHALAPVRARTIAELAARLGLHAPTLARTIADFNAAIPSDAPPLDPTREDARATTGLTPPKSNWAVALLTPPFTAYPVTGGVTFTLGGVRTDPEARVLSADGQPLPGLFAVGDAVGLFHGNYPSGAGQTRNAVFGRRAGRAAAAG